MNLTKLLFFSKIFTGIFISLFIVAQIVIATYDFNKYRDYAIQVVQSKTGHGFSINGDFKINLSPFPVLVIEDIELENSEWGTNPVMFSANRIEMKLAILPLIYNDITIEKLTIIQPTIYVEHKNNKLNWLFKKPINIIGQNESNTVVEENSALDKNNIKTRKNSINKSRKYSLKEAEIKNATLVFNENTSSNSIKFTRSYATISMNSIHSPITFIMGGNYNKRRFNIAGEIDSVMSLIGNKKTSFNTNITISHINTNFSGSVEKPMTLKGLNVQLASELDSLRSLDRILGKRLPHVGPNYMNMTITDVDDNYVINDFNIFIGDKEIKGEVELRLSGYRPSIFAELHTAYFDLTPFIHKKNIEEFISFNSDLISHIDKIDASLEINELKKHDQIENNVNYKMQLHDNSVLIKRDLN